MNEVHLLIEERNIRFLLTGSSARKIKKSGTNLLGGRASFRNFHPFVFPEMRETRFSLERVLYNGSLPPHYLSDTPDEGLRSYVDLYLKEEIAAEGLSRNLPAFSRFLQVASVSNTKILNYTNIGNDAGVPRQTVKQWFQILLDTLLGFELRPFTKTVKRKALETAEIIHDKHMKGLKALREEGIVKRSIIVCREERPRKKEDTEILPWKMFLEYLWDGRIV